MILRHRFATWRAMVAEDLTYPAPPGAAKFSEDAFAKWKTDHAADVAYELLAWPQLHDRMATAFASGSSPRADWTTSSSKRKWTAR